MHTIFTKTFESFFSQPKNSKDDNIGVNIRNMKFSVMPAQYSTLSGLEFVPDFLTQKDYNKQQMFKAITDEIRKKDSFMYELLEYRPLSYSDGLFFEIDTELLMMRIIQTLKK